jgi:hypothetical protein
MSFYFLSTCLVVIADMFHSELVIVRLDTTLNKYNDLSYQDNDRMRLRFCVLFPDRLYIYIYMQIYIQPYLCIYRCLDCVRGFFSKRLVGLEISSYMYIHPSKLSSI